MIGSRIRCPLLSSLALLLGCGGVPLRVESSPPGAAVYLDCVGILYRTTNPQLAAVGSEMPAARSRVGTTPCETTFDPDEGDYVLRVALPGRAEERRFLSSARPGQGPVHVQLALRPE